MRLIRGMAENFNEPCDLIVSCLRAPLNPRMRAVPMLLLGRETQKAALRLRAGVAAGSMVEVLKWGSRAEMRVWAVGAPEFSVPEGLKATPTPEHELLGDVPTELIEALLAEYPGKKDVVADPSMCFGSVGAAAANLGLDFVGYEWRVDAFTKAQERLLPKPDLA